MGGELGAGGGVVQLVVHRGRLARHFEQLRHPAKRGFCPTKSALELRPIQESVAR